jgi:hypothetical protein
MAKNLQLGGVERNVTWNFLQTASRAINCRSFAVTNSGTFEWLSTTIGGVFAFEVFGA